MATNPRDRHTEAQRRARRGQIVKAARDVLARDGLAACTARAVADASPLTKSAIHYYFRDIDEIVDQAIVAHLDGMLATLRGLAEATTDPRERLRAVLDAYLATFADNPHAAFLWFEYWVSAGRRGAPDATDRMLGSVTDLLTDLLRALPVPDAAAHALVSWLLGTVVQQQIRPREPDTLWQEVRRLLALTD